MNKNRCPKYRGQAILALAITLALLAPSRAAAPAALSQQSPPGQDRTSGPYIRLLGWEFDPLHDPEPLHLPSPLQAESYAAGQMNYYLMQFQGPVLPEWQDAVEEEGAVLLDYIPDFTFVVQMDAPTRDRVAQMPMVRWVGIYQAGYRLAPAVLAHAQETLNAPSEPLELRVSVFPGEDLGTVQNQVRAVGGQVLETSENDLGAILRVRADPAAVEALASVNGVRWIEPVPKWELHNSVSVDIMDVRDVWDTHNLYGAGQIVAVCDTGLDQGSTSPANLHDDFEDGSGNARVIALYDLDGDPASGPDDLDSGHGTHVAGSVLGNGYQSGSTPSAHTYPSPSHAGVAPEAQLVFQAVEDSDGYLTGIPDDLNDLFQQAYDDGARIHTNSWGSAEAGTYSVDAQNTDLFVWNNPDLTILFSAGNDGVDNNPGDGFVDQWNMGDPGTAKNAITVGATENNRPIPAPNPTCGTWGDMWSDDFPNNPIHDDLSANNVDGMAAFSSRGPTADGRYKPDISAPGTWVLSTYSQANHPSDGGDQYDGWGSPPDRWYKYMGGTSMSTPLTAGAATLVREFYTNRGETPSAALIKATLANGAVDMYPGQYGSPQEQPTARPNDVQGWGRVNLEGSLFPASPRTMDYFDFAEGLQTNEYDAFAFDVSDGSEALRTTLAWTDYPGTMAAGGGLVNDLDLHASDPSAALHYPANASQRGSTQYGYYDTDPYWLVDTRSSRQYAVEFTPNSYPVTLERALFFAYSRICSGPFSCDYEYPIDYLLRVYDDDGTDGEPGTILHGPVTVRATTASWVATQIPGVTISSGSVYISIQPQLDRGERLTEDDAAGGGMSWYRDGSGWSQWTGRDLNIRAVMVEPDHSTNYDRVNNLVGVDINSPLQTGNYTITVTGYSVAQGPQAYALVNSGALTLTGASSYRSFGSGDTSLRTFGRTGVQMDFSSGPGGAVTVTSSRSIPGDPPPAGKSFLSLAWDISSGMAGFSTRIIFHYDESDLPNGMSESDIDGAYRWNGSSSSWDQVEGTVDTSANTVTVDNVNAFSKWALGGDSPTAVELARFEATPAGPAIRVTWETATEIDNLGFDLYRAESPSGPMTRLNEGLIPSQAPGSVRGATYNYLDQAIVPGLTYYYWLDALDIHGASTRRGPVSATLTAQSLTPSRVFLPLVYATQRPHNQNPP